MEKWWLRKAFDGLGLLPDEVLWRKKEAFSDGVSSKERSWFTVLQEYVNSNYKEELDQYQYILQKDLNKQHDPYLQILFNIMEQMSVMMILEK